MNKTILQVPISTTLRKYAEKQALEQSFSSLQEAVRVFLRKLAQGVLGITFEREEAIQLSAKNARRYDKMIEDVKSGRVKTRTFSDVSSLMKDLNG